MGFRSSIEVNPNEINNLGQIAGDYQDRSAVDGRTLDMASLVRAGLVTPDILKTYSGGALGCAMSHLARWKRGIAAGNRAALSQSLYTRGQTVIRARQC